MVFGDFNAHSKFWGCNTGDTTARIVQIMLDNLALVHLNDGSHTRIAAPPTFSSAVDLILCSKGLALDCTWSVLDDPAGSDHLPIVASLAFPNPVNFQLYYSYF
jgi:endonuclease/exonuclease/phosphatase family metal-dependent hydrolase